MDTNDFMSLLPSRVAAMYQIMQAMQIGATLNDRVEAVLTVTVHATGLKGGTVRLLTPDRQCLELVAAYGLSQGYLAKGQVEVARSGLDRLVLAGETVVVDDAGADPRLQYPAEAAREGIRSMLALPLRFGSRIVGVFRVYSAQAHRFPPEETAFLTAVANAAGASLENARMHEALLDIAQAVGSSLKLADVLVTVLERTVVDLGLRAGLIRLLDPQTGALPLVAAYGLSEAYIRKGSVNVGSSPLDRRVLAGEVIATANVPTDADFQYREAALREGLVSAVSLPLRIHQRAIGVLRVYTAVEYTFTPDETEFLTAVAQIGATAIENARLYEALEAQNKNLEADLQAWYSFVG